MQDELGSPVRLADTEGNLQETYGYDEFGQDMYDNQGQIQPFGYTGYQMDGITETYFAQAREYIPSIGKFASRDLDNYIKIKNTHSINLYNYCMSSPMRYIDPTGNDLEDEYPLTAYSEDDAVQINVSGNEITIDVYIDFEGDENLTTANGTSCKDLAIAGIENWSGSYLDVFGEDVTVSVNVHVGDSSFWDSQRYITIDIDSLGISRASYLIRDSCNSSRGVMHLYTVDSRGNYIFSDEEYARVVTHEMGHIFGITDGYPDIQNVPSRPDASALNIIDKDDVMHTEYERLNISNVDIGMLICAYSSGVIQAYADYDGYTQSAYIDYINQEGKQ